VADEPYSDAATRYAAAPGAPNIEIKIGLATSRRALLVAPVLIAVFGVFRGGLGAVSAAIGVVIVVANFLLAGFVMSKAASVSLSLYHAAALFGFLLRLILITVVMIGVGQMMDIDRLAMGVAAIVSYLVLLSWEAVALSRGDEKELEWS
jgi:hypothetical protein